MTTSGRSWGGRGRTAPAPSGPATAVPATAVPVTAVPAPAATPAVPRPRGAGASPGGTPGGGPAAGLGSRIATRLRERFRLPGRHDPVPHPARLVGVCGWAAGLGLFGLPVAGRSSVAIITRAAPAWFEPTVVTVGMLGIALTVAAFAAIHRRWLPWQLLAAATVLLAANLLLTMTL